MRHPSTPTLVLVHSPLVGASSWQPTAEVLRARGHPVLLPELAEAFADPPPSYPRLARAVAEDVGRHGVSGPLVLVAHSGAGALLPAAAAATATTAAEVVGTVLVDAVLPHPGRAWFDTVPPEMADALRQLADDNGLLPPWNTWFPPGTVEELLPDPDQRARFLADLPRLPLSYFEEPAPETDLPGPNPDLAHHAYLLLSEAYAAEADRAEGRGWRVARLAADHLAVHTAPERVGTALEELLPR